MSDYIEVVVKDNNYPPIIPPTVVALADNAAVRDLMPRLAHMFNLPARNDQGETYFYTMRRAKDTHLLHDGHTLVRGGVFKGDLLLIEPTIPLFEKLKKLDERVNRLGQGLKPRMEYLLDLLPVLRQVQQIIESDFKLGIYYEWVNIDTIMLKRTPDGVAIFIAHREQPGYRESFQNTSLDSIRHMTREQIVERTRSLNLLSPQQRQTGYTQYDSQYLPDNVYSLGATVYMLIVGQLPPVVETNTNLNLLAGQILNQSPEVCEPLCRVLVQAMHPEPRQRFQQPQQFIDALEAGLREWLALRRVMEDALAKMSDLNRVEEARAALQKLGPAYVAGWKLEKHLRRVDRSVESKRLSQLAESKHAARLYAEELPILEELYRLTKDLRLIRPIQGLQQLLNYEEALKLARSNKPPELIKALQLLQALPYDYAEVARYIAIVNEKLNKRYKV